tara:strand:- start:246 stop:677 length:432 start_codon:yes stop_codon:yes gene_type:complete
MSDLTVGTPEPKGIDWTSIILGMCAGASITFLVGAQNGEAVGKSIERATVQCIDELGVRNSDSTSACWDMQADALNKMELQRQAIDRLASRCVLSVPESERLRVTRVKDHKPFKVVVPTPAKDSADFDDPEFFAPGDMDGRPE